MGAATPPAHSALPGQAIDWGRLSAPLAASGGAVELASPWRRLGAFAIDYLVAALLAGLGAFVGGVLVGLGSDIQADEYGTAVLSDGQNAVIYFFAFLLPILYIVGTTAVGAPLGCLIMGMRIIQADSGGVPNVDRAIIRELTRIVSGLAIGLGYLTAFGDFQHQTWHDKAAGVIVIRKHDAPRYVSVG